MQPGDGVSEETIAKITETYANDSDVQSKIAEAGKQKESGPLQFLEDMVPDNAFNAMGDNSLMLQVIFFAIFLGISMLLIGEKRAKSLKNLFDSLNDVVLKMVDLIMLIAPVAVFALLANVVVSSGDPDLLFALLKICRNCSCRTVAHDRFLFTYNRQLYQKESFLVFKRDKPCPIIGVFNEFECCYASGYHGTC